MDQTNLLDKTADLVNEGDHLPITWRVFAQEVKLVCSVAVPMVIVNASTFFLQTITLMMVGHLGKLAQSSTGVSISLCAVTGFSVIVSPFLFYMYMPCIFSVIIYVCVCVCVVDRYTL